MKDESLNIVDLSSVPNPEELARRAKEAGIDL